MLICTFEVFFCYQEKKRTRCSSTLASVLQYSCERTLVLLREDCCNASQSTDVMQAKVLV